MLCWVGLGATNLSRWAWKLHSLVHISFTLFLTSAQDFFSFWVFSISFFSFLLYFFCWIVRPKMQPVQKRINGWEPSPTTKDRSDRSCVTPSWLYDWMTNYEGHDLMTGGYGHNRLNWVVLFWKAFTRTRTWPDSLILFFSFVLIRLTCLIPFTCTF